MNYEEAQQIVEENNHLIDTTFKGKTISKLLIAPLKEVGIAKLMYNDANDLDSTKFYDGFSAFEVWAIFDREDWLQTGVLDKILLSKLLEHMNA